MVRHYSLCGRLEKMQRSRVQIWVESLAHDEHNQADDDENE